jgi:hypothetical protein
MMLAHGFTIPFMVKLINAGLATATAERCVAGGRSTEIARVRITEAGRTMTDPTSLIPISDEQAKAIQEALKNLRGFGAFLRDTFGTVPQDLVGLLGGDWLKVRRAENLARILEKARERLRARHLETLEPASLSIALPILVAAADESRDELQEIWARLLAAAADPGRAKPFRLAFIEATKKLDPLDAAVLQGIGAAPGGAATPGMRNSLAEQLHASRDEIDVSIANLTKLELVYSGRLGSPDPAHIMPFGREFLRAVSD